MPSYDRTAPGTPMADGGDVVFVTELVVNVPARPTLPLRIVLADLLLRAIAW